MTSADGTPFLRRGASRSCRSRPFRVLVPHSGLAYNGEVSRGKGIAVSRWLVSLRIGLAAPVLLLLLMSPLSAAEAFVPGRGDADRVPNQLVIDFADEIPNDQLAVVARRHGLKVRFNSPWSDGANLTVADLSEPLTAADLRRIAADPAIEAVEPNWIYRALFLPNDPDYRYQWHMRQIRTGPAWDVTCGEDVVVAIIDTGVAYEDHGRFHCVEDLKGTAMVPGFNFCDDTEHANDDHCHGTHVAGTVAQCTHNRLGVCGVAFRAAIMPIKVLSAYGGGTLADIADGVRFAADHGAHVINMSLGGPIGARVLEEACDYAHDRGVTIVCAAGNSGQEGVGYPAAFEPCIAVSATRYDEELTFYSTWGKELTVAAPGGDLRVDQNGDGKPDGVLQNAILPNEPDKESYLLFQGTSMASPHVAGVCALICSLGVTRPFWVERVLVSTARPKSDAGWDDHYGHGIVDAERAVERVVFDWGLERLLLALGLALGMAMLLKRGEEGLGLRPTLWGGFGLVLGSSGFFFLPWLGMPRLPLHKLWFSALPAWDLTLFGLEGHGNPLFYSAALPLLVLLLGFSVKPLRRFGVGLALGVAAHLLWHGFFPVMDLPFVPDLFFGERLWLLSQAALSFGLAYLGLGGQRRFDGDRD